MTTNQEARHQDLRDSTSTARGMTADWHALWDGASVADGTFNERLLAWINAELGTSYTNLPGAMHAYAADGGFANWHSINAITTSSGPTYAVNSNEPDTVADFAGVLNSGTEYYRVGGTETTFASMFTYGGSSLGVMTDSDGNLKWAPHNVATYSVDMSSWSSNSETVADDTAETIDPDGGSNATKCTSAGGTERVANNIVYPSTNDNYTFATFLKRGDYDWVCIQQEYSTNAVRAWFNLNTGAKGVASNVGSATGAASSITSVGNGWYLCKVSGALPSGAGGRLIAVFSASADNSTTRVSGYRYQWGSHVYRSDLGGMVNNWDRGDSYVSTTSAARYLPRRNHYRYNGTSYVKKGILLESAAATNLLTHSNTLTSWSILGTDSVTLTAGDATGPDGTSSLTRVAITDTTTEAHGIFLTPTVTVATNTYSCYVHVKPGTQQHVALRYYNATGRWCVIVADLSGLTITQEIVGANSGTINDSGLIEVADGIYMLYMQVTITEADTGSAFAVEPVSSGTPTLDASSGVESYAGTAGLYFHAGFAQLELGSVPTSYIPTSGATATRAAETLTIAGSNMAASTTAMSFHMQGEMNLADLDQTQAAVTMDWSPSTTQELSFYHRTDFSNINKAVLRNEDGSTSDNTSGASDYGVGLNKAFNQAARVLPSSSNIAVNGTASTASTGTSSMPDRSSTACKIGPTGNATFALFRQWDADLTDAGIESASS